jgi:hypothetical protein
MCIATKFCSDGSVVELRGSKMLTNAAPYDFFGRASDPSGAICMSLITCLKIHPNGRIICRLASLGQSEGRFLLAKTYTQVRHM